MAHAARENNIFVARQPIFDRQENVYAYELLYRGNNTHKADFTDGNVATAELVINSFIEFGIEQITGGKLAFINLTREFITGEIPMPLAPANVVLEILEDIEADPESLRGAQALVDRGFTLALDDFMLNDKNSALVPYASIVKVDVMAMSRDDLVDEVLRLRDYPVKLLAEKVETPDDYEFCKMLGFDYFQGYFFSKPVVIAGRGLQPNQLSLLEIIGKLQAPDCDIRELEEIIRHDVGISFKLLKIINSAYFSLPKRVESVQHALVLLGMEALKNWITLIGFSMVENKPDELIIQSLVRARMCEALAGDLGCKSDAAFTVGLFSMLDAMMDLPLAELLANLPLADDIKAALLHRNGKLGELLSAVEGYEKGDWSHMSDIQPLAVDVSAIYLDAVTLANQLTSKIR